jgi:hypothetical protein
MGSPNRERLFAEDSSADMIKPGLAAKHIFQKPVPTGSSEILPVTGKPQVR